MLRMTAVGLVLLLWVGAVLAWPGLPDPIPQRIDARGEVTTTEKSVESWFFLPGLATLTLALLIGVSRVVRARPAFLNIPGREQLMALPPERQAPVLARSVELIDGTIVIMLLIFCVVQYGLWRIAHGGSSQSMLVIVLPLAVLSTPLILGIWLPRITNELERQVQAHRTGGGSIPT